MNLNEIVIETRPDRQDVHFLDQQINAYNIAVTGVPYGGEVSSFVRDARGQIVAGIYGSIWGGCCQVLYVWSTRTCEGKLSAPGCSRRSNRT